jgi:hypothetical protein
MLDFLMKETALTWCSSRSRRHAKGRRESGALGVLLWATHDDAGTLHEPPLTVD